MENTTKRQMGAILSEIASLAHAADRLGGRVMEDGAQRFSEPTVMALCELARKAGMLADLGSCKLGEAPFIGGPERWLLPDAYHGDTEHALAS